MKTLSVFAAVFLLAGICSAAAQDLIILRDGNIIEVKVEEISPTEIRCKRFNNLDGPTIVIPVADVLSIRYENGTSEIYNAVTSTMQPRPNTPALDPSRFLFSVNVNPISAAIMGAALGFEFSKGSFNSEINFIIPSLSLAYESGFGVIAAFNFFGHSRIGGVYAGAGIGYLYIISYDDYLKESIDKEHLLTFGINSGYKFVTKSGIYFRTGAYFGSTFKFNSDRSKDYTRMGIYIKPDLTIGWTMR